MDALFQNPGSDGIDYWKRHLLKNFDFGNTLYNFTKYRKKS